MEGVCQCGRFLVGDVNLQTLEGQRICLHRLKWFMVDETRCSRELGVMRAQGRGQMVADDGGRWDLLQSVGGRLKTVGSPRTKFKSCKRI